MAKTSSPEEIMKKIAPDGTTLVFRMKKPTADDEAYLMAEGYLNYTIAGSGYEIQVSNFVAPYTECEIVLKSEDCIINWDSNGKAQVVKGTYEKHKLQANYVEPKANTTIEGYFKKLNQFNDQRADTYYQLEDLSLINYYATSKNKGLGEVGAPAKALKYSTLNEITKGSNVTYHLMLRAGDGGDMFESAFGMMNVFYNGYNYGMQEEGIYLRRVLYIPDDTADTKEAYVAAAEKRIHEYMGDTSVSVTYGGKLTEVIEDSANPVVGNDGNYYNVKIGNETYAFYLVKKEKSKLIAPVYLGTDLNSKIEITSKDASIPLDTALQVKDAASSSTQDTIGTENYQSYNITLYSNAKESKIEKTKTSDFQVKIPLPKKLEGKDLVVYYLAENGEKEEHKVIVENGYATFVTNHFSTYVLAEKIQESEPEPEKPVEENIEEKDETPKTGKTDYTHFILAIMSLAVIGMVVIKKGSK